jgi:hypothetical protein
MSLCSDCAHLQPDGKCDANHDRDVAEARGECLDYSRRKAVKVEEEETA